MNLIDDIETIIAAYPLLAFAAVFLGGVLSSASPCVLAVIPMVVGLAGGYSEGDRWKAFRYSLAFILGLSLTFTAFGAAAGLLGTMFGSLGGGWRLVAGFIALVMGGQLMGIYTIRLPMKTGVKPRGTGMTGSFLLGLVFGFVSSPCATPVLVVILTLVATTGQVGYGIALLFCYALGHCLLMLFAGTFTGFVEAFALKRGVADVSLWARRISGGIVALAGGYFIFHGL